MDHFSSDDNRTFTNYYYIDDTYFNEKNGPIFVQMGGEGPVSGCSANDLHKSFGALALCVEHRFYGKSNPGRDAEMIKYLSVEQNLADTAEIVAIVQKSLGEARPVMNFGGSYSGATAAWFRDAYPNVTFAGCSSSGVVRALVNFTGFDETVSTALGSSCSNNLKRLTSVFVQLKSDAKKWKEAKVTMRASNLVDTHLGDDDFWYALADAAQMLDQYGHKAILCKFLEDTFTQENDDEMKLVQKYSDFIAQSWYVHVFTHTLSLSLNVHFTPQGSRLHEWVLLRFRMRKERNQCGDGT